MGQKVNPIGLRIGITRTWDSRWFSKGKEFAEAVKEDYEIRKHIKDKLKHAGISKIEIERAANRVRVIIHTARPGIVIGKKGAEIEKLKEDLIRLTKGKEIVIDIQEVRRPELEAQLVAENIAVQLERRVSFRRAMKRAVALALRFGAQGIRVQCKGRLGGAEIARKEWYREGRVPLHTLRADVDYGFAEALTKYGVIGVKVWIFKGEVLPEKGGAGETITI
ncbi:30S ribosomal protein S3 [Thermosulfurimonas dismutans]|uniref:Small ribosomal subunit protein uS3 n=1 Tax=Thermosulfurimonas dismutans TaxID=999894 RepID=A0A179D5Q4_9BACT|nr:30S ribosomal protein S3 [Thermosulfurimonas dismutans]OAQ21059.1 SSU ribosomal protein S3p (S3e) [Thermosulfurimonas dismutans]